MSPVDRALWIHTRPPAVPSGCKPWLSHLPAERPGYLSHLFKWLGVLEEAKALKLSSRVRTLTPGQWHSFRAHLGGTPIQVELQVLLLLHGRRSPVVSEDRQRKAPG